QYRLWLADRYQTVGELNLAWGTTYANFAEVLPSGKPPVKKVSEWIDWRKFSVKTIADFMEWEAGLSKSIRKDLPRTTNLDGPLNNWYGYRCSDNQEYSRGMDNAGIDIYPTEWTDRSFIPYSMDMLMGVAQDREGHVLECDVFSEKLWKNLSEAQRARLLSSELWSIIGHGASCILLRGFDRNDNFNLTSGEFNERLLACRDIAHYAKMIGIGGFARRHSDVAVCVDPDSYLYLSGKEEKPHSQTSGLDEENHGFYSAVISAGIQADVIFSAQMRDSVAKQYKAIVFPSRMLMNAEKAQTLKEYVQYGGIVIADASFAILDRWGKPSDYMPNSGLNQLFGVNYDRKSEAITSGAISFQKDKIPLTLPIENLTLLDAQVLGTLENGKPGLTSKTTGKGKAVLFAGRVGQAYLNNPAGNSLDDALKDILVSASVAPFIEISPDISSKLDCSSLADVNGNLLLVAATQGSKGKMSEEIKDVKVGIPCDSPAAYRKAFLFVPTKNENGIVRSGPKPIDMVPGEKNITLQIGDVVSATPILIAKDMGPLLSVEAVSILRRGQESEIKVTCYNPSAKKLDGTIHLNLPAGFSAVGGKTKISVGPYGQQGVVLKFKVDSDKAIDRAPVSAVLTCPTAHDGVSSVPVDVKVE
ncbi:MAG: beta-galactosidase trimerization domain-containing protein, partial [Victivallales bacterium]